MEKEMAVKILIDQGYVAGLINGVVEVTVPMDADLDKAYKSITKLLKDSGYNASYGVRKLNGCTTSDLR